MEALTEEASRSIAADTNYNPLSQIAPSLVHMPINCEYGEKDLFLKLSYFYKSNVVGLVQHNSLEFCLEPAPQTDLVKLHWLEIIYVSQPKCKIYTLMSTHKHCLMQMFQLGTTTLTGVSMSYEAHKL